MQGTHSVVAPTILVAPLADPSTARLQEDRTVAMYEIVLVTYTFNISNLSIELGEGKVKKGLLTPKE